MEQERANKLLVEARLSSLESRIHPHFLFNTLNSIASLIPTDPKRAEDTVGKLASLLRFSISANHSSLVPLAQELKIVRDYLEIEATRFGQRLHYEISVPDALGDCKVPPLALQTLVENSVKHVVAQRNQPSSISVDGAQHDGRLEITVTDDGPGFSLADISPDHGLGNLVGRLELLFGESAQLNVKRVDDKTVVSIAVPAGETMMTQESAPLRAFLVDDEHLALERLRRLLAAFPEIQITGTATDPSVAVAALNDS